MTYRDTPLGATIANLRQQLAVATEAAALNARERDAALAALADRDRQLAEARALLDLLDEATIDGVTFKSSSTGWYQPAPIKSAFQYVLKYPTLLGALKAYRAATGDKP